MPLLDNDTDEATLLKLVLRLLLGFALVVIGGVGLWTLLVMVMRGAW